MIAAAVFALLEKHVEDGESIEGVSAMDVFNFMQEAAKECPIAQVIYQEIRYAEAVFLMQQAEEESNAEKFVTAFEVYFSSFHNKPCHKVHADRGRLLYLVALCA